MSDNVSDLLLQERAGDIRKPATAHPAPYHLHSLLQTIHVQEYVPGLNKVHQYFFSEDLWV